MYFFFFFFLWAIQNAQKSSSSSSGGGGTPVTPTLASVSNVQIQAASNDGTLSLRWQAPSDATHVVVTATSTTPAQVIQVRVPAIEYRALFQQNRPYTLRGLHATTDYTVEIEAQKDSEVSPKTTRSVTTLSDETAPQDTFTQVAVESATNGIKLTWDKALLSSGKTDIAEATIQVIEKTTGVKTEVSVQDVTQGEVSIAVPTIDGISYDIVVVYKDSNGNKSTAKQALRGIVPSALSQTVAALPEANLTVTANNKDNSPADESLLIKWGSFTFTNKSLQVRVTATATKTVVAEETISKDTSATNVSGATAQAKEYATVYVAKDGIALTTLYGTLTYKVEVYVSQNGKYSTAVSKEQATTDKTTKPATNVSAVGGAISIVVSWQAPDVRDYAGVTITATEKDSKTPAKTVTITDRAVRNTQIIGLKATTEYTVAVQSQDYAGNKGTAENATVSTVADSTAPDAVTNIQASYPFVSATKVETQITWTEPTSNNKDIKEYSVSIQEKGTSTAVVNEKKIPYPTTSLSVEELTQGKTYTVTIQAIDYAENKSSQATQDITTPTPLTAPSAELFQSKPALVTTTGAIQIKATFTQAPGIGRYYTLRMKEGATVIAEKSITNPATTISFGIADGLEVPKYQANAKNYRFDFLQIANNRVSPVTPLADAVAVYDSTSTAPPDPKDATLSVESVTSTTATAVYTFSAGTITNAHKAPNGKPLTQVQIQYKVYIVAGDHSKKTLDAIKALAGVQTRELAGNSAELKATFIGTKGAEYTAGVEAINSLNPAYSIGTSATIKTATLTAPPNAPKVTTYTTNNAVVFAVPASGGNSGKKVITVQLNASNIAGVSKANGNALEARDLAYYVLYLKKEDTTGKPASVSALWAVEKSQSKVAVKVAKYTKATGTTQDTISIAIVDSTSGSNAGATPIETAKDYYIGVRIVNTTSPNYNESTNLFPAGFYTDVAEIKEVYTSKAVSPNQSLLTGKLVVSPSTSTAGTIKLVLTQLSTFTGAKDYDGTSITANDKLVYTVYGLQKDTTPTVAEVLAGRKINIGSVSSRVYTVPALSSLGLSADTAPVVAIKGATKYHFVVEVAVKTDPSKKVVSTVATVTTASQATAPAEVSNIQVDGVEGGNATVSWTASSLTASHKTNKGDTLAVAQVSYKVYKVAKSGSAKSVTAIKNADSSPTTVAAGTTNSTLTGLTVGNTYEIVVQAVNSTDPNKESTGVRKEFVAKEAYAAPGKPTIQANVQGATIVLTITAPTVKGTTAEGTDLRDNQIDYKVYYIASNTSINGATVKTRAQAASDAQVGAEKDDVPTGATSYTIRNLRLSTKYYITAVAVNSLKKTKVSAEATAVSASTPTVVIGNATKVSTTVGSAPTSAHTTRVLTSISPSGLSFTCDESTIDNDNSTLKQETGLTVTFAKNTNTVTITGTANKSNIYDTAITEYNYGVVLCTITSGVYSGGKVLATINVETGLVKLPSEVASYYRPTTKSALKAIITAEKTRQDSGGNSNPSPNLNMIDTSAIDDMSELFKDDSTFNGDITQWNTSNVENFFRMFTRAKAFNQNIGAWDTSKTTGMNNMFQEAAAFNQDISGWDMSNVTRMSLMFYKASTFNQDIGNWNVGNVILSSSLFEGATNFDQDLSSWKLCKIPIKAGEMFVGSAMAGKTAQYPKVAGSSACTSS